MCGIFAVWGLVGDERANWKRVSALAKRLRHRGPDSASQVGRKAGRADAQTYLVHKRLALVAPGPGGEQPLYTDESGDVAWVANGEIYNHQALRDEHSIVSANRSDCQVIGHLYEQFGEGFVDMLDGMFAFMIDDARTGKVFAARDHMGKIPMYIGYGSDGSFWFSSEMKTLIDDPAIERYEIFPPGYQFSAGPENPEGTFTRWYTPRWVMDEDYVPTNPPDLKLIKETVIDAVVKRLMTDVPYGVLLSGGLDSSLMTAIAARHARESTNSFHFASGSAASRAKDAIPQYEAALAELSADAPPSVAEALRTAITDAQATVDEAEKMDRIKSFSIGIKGAPDLAAARKVADFLGTDHTEFYFTPQEAIDALPDVIWHLESWEQVRASVPMYLLSRRIKAMDIRMVLSGEGADEELGGYLYFHKAPSPEEFHKECVRKTVRLHQWDVLRANKSTMAWSVEARTPLLSKQVLDVFMNTDPAAKMIDMGKTDEDGRPYMEKYLLRKAFDDPDDPYLPEEVLWRQKEQFSDGVGYDWVDGLREYAEQEVSDEEFAARAERFPHEPPATKEYYMLRSIFEEHFVTGRAAGHCATATVPTGKSIACSTPEALAWDPEWEKSAGDISGRAVKNVHVAADAFTVGADADDKKATPVAALRRRPAASPRAAPAPRPLLPRWRAPRTGAGGRAARRALSGGAARCLA